MTEILIIFGLILINGVFSMAEIALVSARKARLEGQANKGDEKAKAALKLANNPDVFLSTVQVGITLIGILTGIFSGENLKTPLIEFFNRFEWSRAYSNGIATTVIVVILTYFSLVLGELVPKRIGLSRPEYLAKNFAKPMSWLSRITFPFIWLLTSSTHLIVKLFNLKVSDNQVTEEEIKAMVAEGSEHGAIEEEEKDIIERLFHLGDRNITSLMTHRTDIAWFDGSETVQQVKDKMDTVIYSSYPVCEETVDNIKGIISVKDLLKAPPDVLLKDIAKPALFVPENNTAYQLLEKFKETKIHGCFIVNEYGTLEGMITLNDILEAIVGDVPQTGQDEYEIIERTDGTFLVDGQIPFYDFLSRFEKTEWLNEDDHDFDTLAGFVLHELEHIPHTGETFDWRGFDFEIIDMDGQRIDKLLIKISEELKEEMED
ncbi:MAG: HlyC/CorC family transporter [Chitinophagaceae bacterium]|nr:HlyC/CorC family transporter [Chitinophagaceae bacterium]MBK7308992.1 HlyC/CorC family transporter [Chitinophagaceae bacterium]MBK8788042.1 HlyC/CorC family transporter [Chitinophagaceae bacterium]MBK9483758.1 HlyC/CorC family transporter [Chitinophagaceae bacterium]